MKNSLAVKGLALLLQHIAGSQELWLQYNRQTSPPLLSDEYIRK